MKSLWNTFIKKCLKLEPCFFFLLLLLHLIPVFSISNFLTIDGLAHNYNAYLIKQLLFSHSELINTFHSISPFWIPNSTGHYLLVFLQLFFKPLFAEKILITVLIIGLAYGQRILWKQFSSDYKFWSYFSFPLLFSLSFFFGFYNYTIAIIIYLFLIAYVLKRREGLFTKKADYLFLFLSIGLIYFSHSLMFVLSLFSLGILVLIRSFITIPKEKLFKNIVKQALRLLLLTAPFLVFFAIYMSQLDSSISDWYFMPINDLLSWIIESRTLHVFNYQEEAIYTKIFSVLLGIFLISSIILFFRNRSLMGSRATRKIALAFSLIYLLFYFIFPEYTNDGGIIIIRLQWLFLIFLIALFSQYQHARIIKIIAFAALIYLHTLLSSYYLDVQINRSKEFDKYLSLIAEIEEGSTILPLTKTSWANTHFCNALGLIPNTVVLFNYELEKNYFPLRWNSKGTPIIKLGDYTLNSEDCSFLSSKNTKAIEVIDFVLIHKQDPRWKEKELWKEAIHKSFYLKKEVGKLKLYAKKSPA